MEAVAPVTDEKVKTAEELITDKGYHSKQAVGAMFRAWDCVVTSVNRIGGGQYWNDQHAERDAVYANRRLFMEVAGISLT